MEDLWQPHIAQLIYTMQSASAPHNTAMNMPAMQYVIARSDVVALAALANNTNLEHDPRKWKPVFRKDHSPGI